MSLSLAPSASYHHAAFSDQNSIRLLSLQPGPLKEAIRITLEEISIEKVHDFEALSYVWDLQTPDCPVFCGEKQLLITKNCFDALQRLRFEDDLRLLWIDAICINQTCMREREQQVQLMGDVYSTQSLL